MNSIWLSLLWKEWHEHKWKLAALVATVMLVSLVPTYLWLVGDQISLDSLTISLLACYAILSGLFVGMGVAGKENDRGTVHFLQALPTPMWQPAAAKLILSSIIVIVPIVLVMAVAYGLFHAVYTVTAVTELNGALVVGDIRDEFTMISRDSDWYLVRCVMTVLGTASLLWWMAAGGVNRSDEIRAGAIGFLIIAGIWLVFAYTLDLIDNTKAIENAIPYVLATLPGGIIPAYLIEVPSEKTVIDYYLLGTVAFVSHAAVAAWFLRRFGRVVPKSGKGGSTISVSNSPGWLGLPRRSQFTAIAWKQIRETVPLALFALAAIFCVAALVTHVDESKQTTFPELFTGVGASMSFFVVLVAGIGVFLDDLKPEINNFWRSRPVNLPLWFAVKYLSGLLVLIVVLGVPIALAAGSWSEIENLDRQEIVGGTLYTVWFFALTYSLAIAYQCLVRQPLYSETIRILAFSKTGKSSKFMESADRLPHGVFCHAIPNTASETLPLGPD